MILGFQITEPQDLDQFLERDLLSKKYKCGICGLFSHSSKANARNHVESKHYQGLFTYHCQSCGKVMNTKRALEVHKSSAHCSWTNTCIWQIISTSLIDLLCLRTSGNQWPKWLASICLWKFWARWKTLQVFNVWYVFTQWKSSCEKPYWIKAFSKSFYVFMWAVWKNIYFKK